MNVNTITMKVALLKILVVLLSLSFFSITTTADFDVGIIPASLNVEQGVASVRIPFQLKNPSGSLEPTFSIVSTPGGSNPLLGDGFTFSGFSQIHYCSVDQRYVSENVRTFCVDNMELVLQERDGSNSTFRKRNDDNSIYEKIGNHTWIVKLPNGKKYTYRLIIDNNDSSQPVYGHSQQVWYLSYLENTIGQNPQGIHITYYDQSPYLKPKSITGEEGKIDFIYEESPNKNTTPSLSRSGTQFSTETERLKTIKYTVLSANKIKYASDIVYVAKEGGVGYQIDKITKCNASENCFNNISILYQSKSNMLASRNILDVDYLSLDGTAAPNLNAFTSGDINADGIEDFCIYSFKDKGIVCGNEKSGYDLVSNESFKTYDLAYYQSRTTNQYTAEERISLYRKDIKSINSIQLIDMNKDGYDDICYVDYAKGELHCSMNRGHQEAGVFNDINIFKTSNLYQQTFLFKFGDYNSDGYPDFCSISGSSYQVSLSCYSHSGDEKLFLQPTYSSDINTNDYYDEYKEKADVYKVNENLRIDFSYKYYPDENDNSNLQQVDNPNLWFVDQDGDGRQEICYNGFSITKENDYSTAVTTEYETNTGSFSIIQNITIRQGQSPNELLCISTSSHGKASPVKILAFDELLTGNAGGKVDSLAKGEWLLDSYKTLKITDVTHDGIKDICTIRDGKPLCYLLNARWQVTDVLEFETTETIAEQAYLSTIDENIKDLILSSIEFVDVNQDRQIDICWNNLTQYKCALGAGTQLKTSIVIGSIEPSEDVVAELSSSSKKVGSKIKKLLGDTKTRKYYYGIDKRKLALSQTHVLRDMDGDGNHEICYRGKLGVSCFNVLNQGANRVSGLVGSLGETTKVEYKSTVGESNTSFYTEGLRESGIIGINPRTQLVSKLISDNGLTGAGNEHNSGSENVTDFKYSNFAYDPVSAKYQGLQKVNAINSVTGIESEILYSVQPLKQGVIESRFSKDKNGDLISQENYEYATGTNQKSTYYTRLIKSEHKKLASDGDEYFTQTISHKDFKDNLYARKTEIITHGRSEDVLDKKQETIKRSFKQPNSIYALQLIELELKTIEANTQDEVVKIGTKYFYDDHYRIKEKIVNTHDGETLLLNATNDYYLKTEYKDFNKWDKPGEIINTERTNKPRNIVKKYTSEGWLKSETNALGHSTEYNYLADNGMLCGKPTQLTDANNQIVEYKYDNWCRRYFKHDNNKGHRSEFSWQWDDSVRYLETGTQSSFVEVETKYNSDAAYSAKQFTTRKTSFIDRLGRNVREVVEGDRFNTNSSCGEVLEAADVKSYDELGVTSLDIFLDTEYKANGEIHSTTEPYGNCIGQSLSLAHGWRESIYEYDERLRAKSITSQDEVGDRTRTFDYDGNITRFYLNGEQEKSVTSSVHGGPLKIAVKNQQMSYQRDGLGQTVAINRGIGAGEKDTIIDYDLFGRKILMVDPDRSNTSGTNAKWISKYNGYGELVQQKTPNGNTISYDYDKLGRLIEQKFLNGTDIEDTWAWEYDKEDPYYGENIVKGMLTKISSQESTTLYDYNKRFLIKAQRQSILLNHFETKFEYDEEGRLKKEQDEKGVYLKRYYDSLGRPMRVVMPGEYLNTHNLEKLLAQAKTQVEEVITELDNRVSSNLTKGLTLAQQSETLFQHYKNLVDKDLPNKRDLLDSIVTRLKRVEEQKEAAFLAADKAADYKQTFINRGMNNGVTLTQHTPTHVFLKYHFECEALNDNDGKRDNCHRTRGHLNEVVIFDTYQKVYSGDHSGYHTSALAGSKTNEQRLVRDYDCRGTKLNGSCKGSHRRDSGGDKIQYHSADAYNPTLYYSKLQELYTQLETTRLSKYNTIYKEHLDEYTNIYNLIESANNYKEKARKARENWLSNARDYQADYDKLQGFRSALRELDQASTKESRLKGELTLWAATRYQPNGILHSELYGNGYITTREFQPKSGRIKNIKTTFGGGEAIRSLIYGYNSRGNLDSRTDSVTGSSEDFNYADSLSEDRLTSWSYSANGVDTINRTYSYDDYGNMSTDNGLGLSFDSQSHRIDTVGQTNSKPDYDKEGNIKNDALSSALSATWTAFDKPESISKGSKSAIFSYQAGGQKVAHTEGAEKRFYLSPMLEIRKKGDEETRIYSVKIGNDTVAMIAREGGSKTDKIGFIHRDALGNTDTVTDIQGKIITANGNEGHTIYSPYGEMLGYVSSPAPIKSFSLAQASSQADDYIESSARAATKKPLQTVKEINDVLATTEDKYRARLQAASTTTASFGIANIKNPELIAGLDIIKGSENKRKVCVEEPVWVFVGSSVLTPILASKTVCEWETDRYNLNLAVSGQKEEHAFSSPDSDDLKGVQLPDSVPSSYSFNSTNTDITTATVSGRTQGVNVDFIELDTKATDQHKILEYLPGFTGQRSLSSFGLVDMNARLYQPSTGRFISADAIIPNQYEWDGYNRYMYVMGNPMKYRDPSGHKHIIENNPELFLNIEEWFNPETAAVAYAVSVAFDNTFNPVTYSVQDGYGVDYLDAVSLAAGGVLGKTALKYGSEAFTGAKTFTSNFEYVAKGVTNPVPDKLARVVPGDINPKTLGRTDDVFVTDAKSLQGLNSKQIAEKLTIPESSTGFKVIEFPSSNVSGIASPINRSNPGFVQGGRTAGGAPEFVIPNGPIPAGSTTRVVQ